MNQHHYLIIMAGGIGSRFWPFSREAHPKQFHDVLGIGSTLLQLTASRFTGIIPPKNIYVATSEAYVDIVQEQLPFLNPQQILAEPYRKNTAPCIAYATYKISSQDPKAIITVAPSDHIILKEVIFGNQVKKAVAWAESSQAIITLGIKPTRPDTGYGYIHTMAATDDQAVALKFHEKPSLDLAKEFISSGQYVWNAGLFVFAAETVISAFAKYTPELHQSFNGITDAYYTDTEQPLIAGVFNNCTDVSFDYAIMEHATQVGVVICDIGWSDLGTWKALYEIGQKDQGQNVIDGQIVTYEVENSIIKTPKDRLVVVQGLKDFIVAEYDNVLMICQKDQEQRVKQFVAAAKQYGEIYV